MERTIYLYDLKPVALNENINKIADDYEQEFINILDLLITQPLNERVWDIEADNKILYLDGYEVLENIRTVNMCFISAKYNSVRKVIDTETLKDKGYLKNKEDGDKEKNHISIKFYDDKNPLCLYEYNKNGTSISRIINYVNRHIKSYHKSDEKKPGEKGIRYKFDYKNIVSKDFLSSLDKVKRVKAVTLTVDRKDINMSEIKELYGRGDLSTNADIVLKPEKTGIFHDTVKDFFNMYNDKHKIIKRVTVDGDSEEKHPISFNTEQMKEKDTVVVDTDIITGEVKTDSIYRIFAERMEDL